MEPSIFPRKITNVNADGQIFVHIILTDVCFHFESILSCSMEVIVHRECMFYKKVMVVSQHQGNDVSLVSSAPLHGYELITVSQIKTV